MAMGTFVGSFVLFFIIAWLAFVVLMILALIFWIFMLIDVAKRNFKNENDKIIWVIIVALLSWIGALIYYFVIKKPNKR
jgi:hypothetical protein